MAEAPKTPRATGKPGKTIAYTLAGLVALGGAYYLYRHYQQTGSLNPLSSGTTGTTSGSPTTTDTGTTTTTNPNPTTAAPKNLAEWKAAVLSAMVATGIKGGENVAATGLANALSGHCVGPNEYAALNSALATVGQPPGNGILTLSLCKPKAKATTTSPGHHDTTPTTTHTTGTVANGRKDRAAATVAANRTAHNPLTRLKLPIGKK